MSDDTIQPGLPAAVHLLKGLNEAIETMPSRVSALESSVLSGQQAVLAAAATVNALLAVEARLGEMVEQQRLANILAIRGKSSGIDLEWEIEEAANEYLRGQLASLLKSPEPGE